MQPISHILARPMVMNVPEMDAAVIVRCQICGAECWKRDIEPDPLPQGVTAACTKCALSGRLPHRNN